MKHDIKPKKGRDTKTDLLMKSSRETLMNLPEHLIGKDILPNHILKKTGEAFVDDEITDNDQEDDELELVQFKRYNLPAEIQITSGTGNRRGKELDPGPGSEEESERWSDDQMTARHLAFAPKEWIATIKINQKNKHIVLKYLLVVSQVLTNK